MIARRANHESTQWPTFERVPAVAFVDVDGTLLAQTTTFLFARILYRRGWIRRSFFLRAVYHGLQHRFGRLDYGRLIGIGMTYISSIPVVELERIAYENFVEFVRPRLYEGVVEHLYGLRRRGTAIVLVSSSPGIVIQPLSIYLSCTDTLTTPVVIERGRLRAPAPALRVMARANATGPRSGQGPWRAHGRYRGLRRQLERSSTARKSRPGRGRSSTWPSVAAGASPELGHRPAEAASSP